MTLCRALFALVVAFALPLCVAQRALAGAPTDQLHARVDRVFQVLRGSESKRTEVRDPQAAIRRVLDEMFDWTEMGKLALGRHWRERTPDERAEFIRLFSDLFEGTYVSKVKLAEALTFTYLGDTVAGDKAVVRTMVTTKHGNEIAVDYRSRLREGTQWKVYDLDVEGVSLVDNYRFQIDKILSRSSFGELVKTLKAKLKRAEGSSAAALPS